MRNMQYNEYLKSDHWQKLRKLAWYKFPHKCSICGTKDDLVLHHRTYKDLGHESLNQITIICQTHHTAIHYENGQKVPLLYNILYGRELRLRHNNNKISSRIGRIKWGNVVNNICYWIWGSYSIHS